MSRRQGRISNRGNAKVGAGGRQKGYQTAGRVKRQAANGQSRIGSPGKHTQGNRLEMSDGAEQDFAMCAWKCAAYMCVCE